MAGLNEKKRPDCKKTLSERKKEEYDNNNYTHIIPNVIVTCLRSLDEMADAWDEATFPDDVQGMEEYKQVDNFFQNEYEKGMSMNEDSERQAAGYALVAVFQLVRYAEEEHIRERWQRFLPQIVMQATHGAVLFQFGFIFARFI